MKEQDVESHLEHLDDLLKQYLGFLDEYHAARQELSRHLSTGFFNLAQANRSAGPGRRYGQDYYDERMQASRRVSVMEDDEGSRVEINSTIPEVTPAEQNEKEELTKDPPSDPLRWFGILVPPALRSAKTDFAVAVDDPIPRILNSTKKMHQLEHEISRLRKSIKKHTSKSGAVEEPRR